MGRLVFSLAGLVVILLGGCSSAPSAGIAGPCVPGVVRACTCDDGRAGGQGCGPNRSQGLCQCGREGGAEPDPTALADFLLDFGPVPVGERASRTFPVANLGEEHLVFRVGTVSPPFYMESRVPLSVAPRGSDELRFGFRPTAEADVSVVVPISTGGSGFSLRLAGTGFEPRIDCDTDRLDFPAVPWGGSEVQEVRCLNLAPEPMVLTAAVEGDAGFSVAPLPTTSLPWGEAWTVAVTVTPESPNDVTGKLRLGTPGGTVLEEIDLWASVASLGISCAPTEIDFGRVEPGATAVESIVCTNWDDRPWVVTVVDFAPGSDTEAFSVANRFLDVPPLAGGEPGVGEIEVYFRPPEGTHETYDARLILTCDYFERMDVTIRGSSGEPR
jgi:hypothetical protein